jgi:hypothetical protein
MKTFLSLLALPALLFIGCVDNSSNVDPDDVEFIDHTPDNNVYPIQYESIDIDISSGSIELKVEPFIVDNSQISYNVMEIGGARYAFTR